MWNANLILMDDSVVFKNIYKAKPQHCREIKVVLYTFQDITEKFEIWAELICCDWANIIFKHRMKTE